MNMAIMSDALDLKFYLNLMSEYGNSFLQLIDMISITTIGISLHAFQAMLDSQIIA